MAEVLLSPGISLRENDTSQITTGPITAGLSLVGPTVKGRVNIPTLVTSYSDYKSKFGDVFMSGSNNYEFLTSIAAQNYFSQGGETILVTRVTSQSYAPATASVPNSIPGVGATAASASFLYAWTDPDPANPAATNPSNYEIKVVYGANLYRFIAIDTSYGPLPEDDVDGLVYYYTWEFSPTSNGDIVGTTAYNFIQKHNAILGASGFNLASASYNSLTTEIDINALNVGTQYNNIMYINGDVSAYYDANYAIIGYTVNVGGTLLADTANGTNGTESIAFILETLSEGVEMNNVGTIQTNGSLLNGTSNNIRWQVVFSDSASGQFSLVIRQGNDTTSNPTVLETWTNMSLDPNASNYVARVIGDMAKTVSYDPSVDQYYVNSIGSYPNASRYVRVKEVVSPTPDYFYNNSVPKPFYGPYLPLVGSGSQGGAFSGATGNDLGSWNSPLALYENIGVVNVPSTQGVSANSYVTASSILANSEEYDYQLLSTPGLVSTIPSHYNIISDFATITQERGDSFYILDLVGYNATVGLTANQATTFNTNYAAAYWPWMQTISSATGKLVWVPASTLMPGVYAFNDRVSAEWFAPAGLNRGGIGGAVQAERKLSTTDRDTLYQNKVNPIATFPGVGLVAYGQKTLQTQASALDRVNVRRLLINLKRFVRAVAETLLFEQNTLTTRNNFISQVNPYLESVQQRQGLYAYKVVMDDSNNTPDTIDRNQLVGAIYIQPAKSIEFIYIDFNITPTGVTFGS